MLDVAKKKSLPPVSLNTSKRALLAWHWIVKYDGFSRLCPPGKRSEN